MKIGFVLDDSLDKPDGVQQAVLTTGEWMRSKGHEVHYLVGRTERTDIENVHSLAKTLNVKFNGNSMGTPLPASSSQLKEFFASHHFDVLHVQMPYSPFFAAKIIKLAPKSTKIVGTFHILPYSRISSIATKQLSKFLRGSLKRFNAFISVSEPAANFAKASFGISSVVIPNPVNTVNFIHARGEPRNSRQKQIVFLGRLEERKGIIELVKAYKQLLENDHSQIKKTKLVIGGKGPLKDTVHGLLMSLPFGAQSELLGFIPEADKAKLLASADVAVFPSTSGESFGIVLVEAMAAGSGIIVAGNNPGYTSVLGAKPELLFNPRNTQEFADKLAWALSGAKKTKKLGDWLRAQAMKYDVANVGEQLLKLYKSRPDRSARRISDCNILG